MIPKVWGSTELLVNSANFEAHRIEVRKGGFTSLHKHGHKFNMIRVEMGTLHIDAPAMKPAGANQPWHVLKAGQSVTIPPGMLHRFLAVEDTIAYEFYWVSIDLEDIVRFDVGGSQ